MIDEIAFVILIASLIITWLLYRFRHKHPGTCSNNVIHNLYANWVDARLSEANPLTAVQALRNMLHACSIFITATLILLGLLIERLIVLLDDTTPFLGGNIVSLGQVKASSSIIAMFSCVFSFTIATWMAGRASMLVTANPTRIDPNEKVNGLSVTKATIMSMHKYWLGGVRGMFFMLGVVSWLISPVFMMMTTLATSLYLIWFLEIRSRR